ncbi:MAG: hypothetical protein M8353_06140 [ANME-2 cluster archaeon]|nr:hypothetical protein [ANME-2 cluster archaeon]
MGKETTSFDYEDERRNFTWDVPADYNFVDVIRGWAQDKKKLIAVTQHPDGSAEEMSYREIWDNALQFGTILIKN